MGERSTRTVQGFKVVESSCGSHVCLGSRLIEMEKRKGLIASRGDSWSAGDDGGRGRGRTTNGELAFGCLGAGDDRAARTGRWGRMSKVTETLSGW